MDIENISWVRIWSNENVQGNRQCNFEVTGENVYGYQRFKRGEKQVRILQIQTRLLRFIPQPDNISKIDRALICQTSVSLDKSVKTRVDNKKPRKQLFSELEKLQEAGYRANEKKS